MTAPVANDVTSFLDKVHQLMIRECLEKGKSRDGKVVEFLQPGELQKEMQFPVGDMPESHDKLLELCEKAVRYSVKTGHPRFFNQLYAGVDPYSLAGSWITDALNTNSHTYEVAPVFLLAEHYLVQKMCSIVGYKDGDGLFNPGGTFSNLTAVHVARYQYNKQVKKTGLFGMPQMILFASDQAHYSISTAASFLGFGLDSVVMVKTDERGCMDPQDFQTKIQETKAKGDIPFFVQATAGSTVLGSFDDLNAVSAICQEHGVWLHLDAAWGGGVLLSKTYRHLMSGIEKCDSVAWNPHKMMGANLQCSVLLTKQKGLLLESNANRAEYLFQPDKFYDTSFDAGDKSIQCGRRADAFKLWLMWKAKGDKAFENEVDKAYEKSKELQSHCFKMQTVFILYLCRLFIKKLKQREGFRLVLENPQCTNVSFWYIPPSMRGQTEDEEWWKRLGQVAPKVKERMTKAGNMLIGFQPVTNKGWVNFFRIIFRNPVSEQDLDFIIEEFERLGGDL
ncbi:cysteine sulfinic acid decarboxylase [Lingula anatina]|uniref:Cysteine sulfinic acid decarboxylase n=1 Tax=Lingula anatina TaxID=7574 RepID=A0A1S3IJE8_LINAN|nr:cysteine sulfinic acid decarboxylase [Lingula anatina]|eukprot:XP_013398337.1 cysteine sulfinic acid decarboxylase [Lingula anatina]